MKNVDPRIRFETKEESNERRRAVFMALTPHERFMVFLKGFSSSNGYTSTKGPKKDNFIIERPPHAVR